MTEQEALKKFSRILSLCSLDPDRMYDHELDAVESEIDALSEELRSLIHELYEDRFILEGLRK
jgi:hypothetical protein